MPCFAHRVRHLVTVFHQVEAVLLQFYIYLTYNLIYFVSIHFLTYLIFYRLLRYANVYIYIYIPIRIHLFQIKTHIQLVHTLAHLSCL